MVKASIEMGIIGGSGMALSIFLINLTGGVWRACVAAGLQFIYSAIVIGFNTELCRIQAKRRAIISIWLPTILTTSLTYVMHMIGKSPEPFWSAVFAFATALPSFWIQQQRFTRTNATLLELIKKHLR